MLINKIKSTILFHKKILTVLNRLSFIVQIITIKLPNIALVDITTIIIPKIDLKARIE
jgi:hypothetical protein